MPRITPSNQNLDIYILPIGGDITPEGCLESPPASMKEIKERLGSGNGGKCKACGGDGHRKALGFIKIGVCRVCGGTGQV